MKFLRGFLSFIAVLLCIVLFVSTLVTMLVADVRVITSKDNLKVIINQFITGSAYVPGGPAGLTAGNVVFSSESEEEGSAMMDLLVDKFYGLIAEQYGEEVPFTQEEVKEFINESTLPEFVSDKAAGIISDLYTGEETTTITVEDVQELIDDNKALIEDTLQIEVTDEMVTEITGWVEKTDVTTVVKVEISEAMGIPYTPPATEAPGDDTENEGNTDSVSPAPSPEKPQPSKPQGGGVAGDVSTAVTNIQGLIAAIKAGEKVSLPVVLNVMRSVTSQNILLLCIGVCAVLMLLIFVCKLDRWYAALRSCGIVFLTAGIFMLLPVLAGQFLHLFIPDPMISGLAKTILNMTALVSGGVAGFGLVCVIVGCIFSGIAERRRHRKLQQAYYAPVMESAPVPEVFCDPGYAPCDAQEAAPAEMYDDAPVEHWIFSAPAEAPAQQPAAEEAPAEVAAEAPAEAAAEVPAEPEVTETAEV